MGALDFIFECIKLLQNDFRKQRYITLNATTPGQDRIYPKSDLCRTFFAEYTIQTTTNKSQCHMDMFAYTQINFAHVSKSSFYFAITWT